MPVCMHACVLTCLSASMMYTHLCVSVPRGSGLTLFCDHLRDINIFSLKQMNIIVIVKNLFWVMCVCCCYNSQNTRSKGCQVKADTRVRDKQDNSSFLSCMYNGAYGFQGQLGKLMNISVPYFLTSRM